MLFLFCCKVYKLRLIFKHNIQQISSKTVLYICVLLAKFVMTFAKRYSSISPITHWIPAVSSALFVNNWLKHEISEKHKKIAQSCWSIDVGVSWNDTGWKLLLHKIICVLCSVKSCVIMLKPQATKLHTTNSHDVITRAIHGYCTAGIIFKKVWPNHTACPKTAPPSDLLRMHWFLLYLLRIFCAPNLVVLFLMWPSRWICASSLKSLFCFSRTQLNWCLEWSIGLSFCILLRQHRTIYAFIECARKNST